MPESKTSERRITAAQKQRRALELRAAGKTFPQIAEELGYRSVSSAYGAVMRGLERTLQEPAEELRRLEAERLDRLFEVAFRKATRDGSVWAVDRCISIMERRARLFGLDREAAPDEVEKYLGSFLAGIEAERARAEDLSE